MKASPMLHNGVSVQVTASIGIGAMLTSDASPDMAIIRADQALYRAKSGGRNQTEVAP